MVRTLLVTGAMLAASPGVSQELQEFDGFSYIPYTQEDLDYCINTPGCNRAAHFFSVRLNRDYEYTKWCLDRPSCGVPTMFRNYWTQKCSQWSGKNLGYRQLLTNRDMCIQHECVAVDFPQVYSTPIRYTLSCKED